MKSMCFPSSAKRWRRLFRAVGDDVNRRLAPRVDPVAVRLGQLPRFRSAASERADVLALRVVLVDVGRAVAVADVDIAVRRNRDVRRVVARRLAVGSGPVLRNVRRTLDLPDLFPLQRRLQHDRLHRRLRGHLRIGRVGGQVEELVAPLFADVQPVRHPAEFLAPGPHELAIPIEDHHRIRAVAGGVHGVMDVDVPLRVLDDAMGVAPLDLRRQHAPIVNGLVAVGPVAQHRRLRAGLVLDLEQQRSQNRTRHRRRQELSSSCSAHRGGL